MFTSNAGISKFTLTVSFKSYNLTVLELEVESIVMDAFASSPCCIQVYIKIANVATYYNSIMRNYIQVDASFYLKLSTSFMLHPRTYS